MNEILTTPFLNTKTINPETLPADAWRVITGNSNETSVKEYYQRVPWLFRAVDIRANALSNIPFSIYRGSEIIDNSDDYQNIVKFY